MADLVGAFAASHGPIIARDWETMAKDHRDRLAAGFDEIGRRLKACRPDLLVVIMRRAEKEVGDTRENAFARVVRTMTERSLELGY